MRARLLAGARRNTALTVLGAALVLIVLYPLVRLLWESMAPTETSNGHSGAFANYKDAFTLPEIWGSVRGTLLVAICTLAIAVPVAVALAWVCAATDAPLARAFSLLPIISLAISPLTLGLGWLVLLSPRSGILNVAIRDVFHLDSPTGPFNATSPITVIVVLALHVVPYVYGPAYTAFGRVDGSLLEAARTAGASTFNAFVTVVVPVVRPAILAGTLIAGVNAAESFSIPYILSGANGVEVLPKAIYTYVLAQGNVGLATALSTILTVLTLIATLAYLRLLGDRGFVTVGGKGLRRISVPLRRLRYPTTVALALVAVLSFVLPVAALAYLAFAGSWSARIFSQPLTLRQFDQLVHTPAALGALENTAWIAVTGATLALAVGFIGAVLLARRRGFAPGTIRILLTLPLGVPALVTGLAVLGAFIGKPFGLYGTPWLLILGFTVLALPIAFQYSESALRQVSSELTEAAAVAGDPPLRAFLRITVPTLRRPILVAWATIFIILAREIGVAIMVYTPASIVGSVWLFNDYTSGLVPRAAAYAVVLTALSGIVVWVILRLNRERH